VITLPWWFDPNGDEGREEMKIWRLLELQNALDVVELPFIRITQTVSDPADPNSQA
jgi:hypothetical protein